MNSITIKEPVHYRGDITVSDLVKQSVNIFASNITDQRIVLEYATSHHEDDEFSYSWTVHYDEQLSIYIEVVERCDNPHINPDVGSVKITTSMWMNNTLIGGTYENLWGMMSKEYDTYKNVLRLVDFEIRNTIRDISSALEENFHNATEKYYDIAMERAVSKYSR